MPVNIDIDGNKAFEQVNDIIANRKDEKSHVSIIEVQNIAVGDAGLLHFEDVHFDDKSNFLKGFGADFDSLPMEYMREDVIAVDGPDRASGLMSFTYGHETPRYRILFFFFNSLHSGNRVQVHIQSADATKKTTKDGIKGFLKTRYDQFVSDTDNSRDIPVDSAEIGAIRANSRIETDGDRNHILFKLKVKWS